MVFLQITTLLLLVSGIWAYRHATISEMTQLRPWMIAAIATCADVYAFMLGMRQSTAVGSTEPNWSVVAYAAAASLWLVAFGWQTYFLARTYHFANPRTVLALIFSLLSLYLVGTTADHFYFGRPGYQGEIAADAIENSGVPCAGMAIYRFDDEISTYRCPTSIALSNLTTQPFIPWPDYQEGHSPTLKQAVTEFVRQADENTAKLRDTQQK